MIGGSHRRVAGCGADGGCRNGPVGDLDVEAEPWTHAGDGGNERTVDRPHEAVAPPRSEQAWMVELGGGHAVIEL